MSPNPEEPRKPKGQTLCWCYPCEGRPTHVAWVLLSSGIPGRRTPIHVCERHARGLGRGRPTSVR